jgi:hypothetical protein
MVTPEMLKSSLETQIAELDTTLFDDIPSQTDVDDRRSFLAIQAAVAARRNPFTYLEIGSHLGGSIQPYLRDLRCAKIVSIDKRPEQQPDERGGRYVYRANSTQRMMENLKRISNEAVAKVVTFDADTSEVDRSGLPCKPDVCLIDGEHTNLAVERDFAFCVSAMADSGVICFHDSNVIFQALATIVDNIHALGRPFQAYNLPKTVFVIDFGMNLHEDTTIKKLLLANHVGYLSALESMADYRAFYNCWVARTLRRARRLWPV